MSTTDRSFRDVLGLFPTGVAVITTIAADGSAIGMTVSSFNSVSLVPPLVLFSIGRQAQSLPVWLEAKQYAVNILREDQSEISTRFAHAGGKKWEGLTPRRGVTPTVLLPDALAWLECESHAHHEGGDHVIMVGKVLSFGSSAAATARPLVFFRGRYRQLDAEHQIPTAPDLDHLLHGW